MINNVYKKLEQIGWYQGRSIEVTYFNKIILEKPLNFIKEFGGLYYTSDNKVYFDFVTQYKNILMGNMSVVPILHIFNAIFGKKIIVMNKFEEIYIYNDNLKFANNTEDFFEKILKNDFNIKTKIDDRTFYVLKKSGWNINRKVDISDMYNYLKINNIELFRTAYVFFENFYNLSGTTWGDDSMEWRILNEYDLVDRKRFFKFNILDNIINTKYLPVCTLDEGMVTYYITENNHIYNEMGTLVGNNTIEGLNSILKS